MYRSQGKDWAEAKPNIVEVLGYYENELTGRIKVFVRTRLNKNIIYHWLNDGERKKFEKNKHKYPLMDQSAKVVKGL